MGTAGDTRGQVSKQAVDQIDSRIDPADLRYEFTRSGGPGGQNVNKVNTRVTLLFNTDGDSAFSAAERDRIRTGLGTRLTRDGWIRVVSSRHRTQRANREAARERLCALIAEALKPRKKRKATRVPAGAKRRRIEEKLRVGEKKRLRGRPRVDD
jgi:ribosome-associated protein